MRFISNSLDAHLKGERTTLATCWKITRTDGLELGFTDHDEPLTFGALEYASIAGFSPTTVESKSNMSVDNLDVEGHTASGSITESDLLAGLYDYAEVEIFLVNYEDLAEGSFIIKRGRLGEVTLSKNFFRAELRGFTQHLSQTIGEVYSPSCRALLGDGKCKVDLAGYTFEGTVTEVEDNATFTASVLTQPAGYYTGGLVKWKSGDNAGRSMEVKEFSAGRIVLALPMGYSIKVGDVLDAIAGCDKTKQTCIAKFNNIINFRGEPDVPGMDAILTTAGTAESNTQL